MGMNGGRRSFLHLAVGSAAGALLGATTGAVTVARAAGVPSKAPSAGRARIVVAGGGFGGSTCALHLRALDPSMDVVLVDPDERYVTCPMSNAVLAGLRTISSLTVTRSGLRRAGVTYVRDRVTAINPEDRSVRLERGGSLKYDRLVVAPGIRMLWGTPEGYDEAAAQVMPHAWQAGPQTVLLARQLQRMRNGGVVAISVPAGPLRCPPGPYERASLIATFLQRHKPRSKVLIFDSNNHFPRQDVFMAAWQERYAGMIEWVSVVAGGAIMRVDTATMSLISESGAHRADVANVIPAQGPGSPAVAAGLAMARGWCPVDPRSFESTQVPSVHVVGDACIADPMPKSASAAVSQARACARAIVAALAGREASDQSLDSICYSQLGPGAALSIHGHFRAAAASIQQLAEAADSGGGSMAEQAGAAESWYRTIVEDAFGAAGGSAARRGPV